MNRSVYQSSDIAVHDSLLDTHAHRIGVRLNTKEYHHLLKMAEKLECSISDVIRTLITDAEVITKTIEIPVVRIERSF
jgi:predicted DNA-binding ribbon-helix-helix protein